MILAGMGCAGTAALRLQAWHEAKQRERKERLALLPKKQKILISPPGSHIPLVIERVLARRDFVPEPPPEALVSATPSALFSPHRHAMPMSPRAASATPRGRSVSQLFTFCFTFSLLYLIL